MKGTVAVYAGSFDPLTVGHLWIIKRGAKTFGRLVVAVGINPEKQCMFSVAERLSMIRASVRHLPNVRVDSFPANQYLINYARSVGAQFILRGIRSPGDYEYEHTMRNINGDIDRRVTTYFLMPPREFEVVSSSTVKGLVGPLGWEKLVRRYLPAPVFNRFRHKHYARTRQKTLAKAVAVTRRKRKR